MSVYEALPQADHGVHIHRGHFARAVLSTTVKAYVILPAFDKNLLFGPCPWMPRYGVLPDVGDECLVLFDNNRQPWIVAWWPTP